jgi:hypothetical protein
MILRAVGESLNPKGSTVKRDAIKWILDRSKRPFGFEWSVAQVLEDGKISKFLVETRKLVLAGPIGGPKEKKVFKRVCYQKGRS